METSAHPGVAGRWHEWGVRLLLAGEAMRASERWLYSWQLRDWLPGVAEPTVPGFGTPLEFWPTPWPEVSLLICLSLCLWALRQAPGRCFILVGIFAFNVLTISGARGVAPSTVLLQPALLAVAVYEWLLYQGLRARRVIYVLVTLLAAMYGFNGLAKLPGSQWQSGDAIGIFLTSNLWSVGLAEAPKNWAMKVLTWGFLVWEVSGFLLLWRQPKWWKGYGAIAIVFHGVLFFITPFRALSLIAIGLWLIVLATLASPPDESVGKRGGQVFSAGIAGWCLWLLLSNTPVYGLWGINGRAQHFLWLWGLNPTFRLFAPNPYAAGQITVGYRGPGTEWQWHSKGYSLNFLLELGSDERLWKRFGQAVCAGRAGTVEFQIRRPPRKKEYDYEFICPSVSSI
jgi:hypothetical protein